MKEQFYYLTSDETISKQDSSKNGLSSSEARARLETYGKNELEEGQKKSLFKRILEQISDPMIIVLIAAAILSGLFSEIADMIIILIVVVLNAVLGIYQESKAERAIEALQEMSAPFAKVRRDGAVIKAPASELVPGDIVLLEAGDSVPADIRLIDAFSFKAEEAALTGESLPVTKSVEAIEKGEKDVSLGDRVNMSYMGSSVAYGRGEGVVVGTGMNTEMGKIANILAGSDEEKTPLQQKLASLSKILSVGVLIICAFIFAFNIITSGGFSGGHALESLLTAISLAVAAIPEGLVVVVTVLLSIGVTKMSKRNAIIRKLSAVETLGCAQVICSDKTGTLTQNKMTVVDHYGDEKLLASIMGNCNDVQADKSGGFVGDPTEIALKEYAIKVDAQNEESLKREAEAPFDSMRKMMSTIHKLDGGKYRQYTKGAPDEIIKRSEKIYIGGEVRDFTDELREEALRENSRMGAEALRALAGAYRDYDLLPEDMSPESLEASLVFVGITGMIDPVRPEAKAAIEECHSAGISAIMITGDHKNTAVAIAKDLGILQDESQAITGLELSEMSDKELEANISKYSVYARVQPEHKVRIVNAWKKKGKIAAMTGDGVNDAPALKSADIGVGMGITGTDVTKNVADMVLSDDNFATIVYAVEEGRRIYENIRKAIQFLLASNLSEVVSIFIGTLAGIRIFAPIHVLWINLITDTFPAMALGMEEAEPDSMQKPPRDSKETIFADGLGFAVILQGVAIGLLTLISFFIGNSHSHLTGMTMAFLTLSMCEIFHSFNMRSRDKSIFSLKTHNKYLFAAMLGSFVLTIAVMYIPGLNGAFNLTPLSLREFLISFGLAISIIPLVEVGKLIKRNFFGSKR